MLKKRIKTEDHPPIDPYEDRQRIKKCLLKHQEELPIFLGFLNNLIIESTPANNKIKLLREELMNKRTAFISKGLASINAVDAKALCKNLQGIETEMEEGNDEAIQKLFSAKDKQNIVTLYRNVFFEALNSLLKLKGNAKITKLDIAKDIPKVVDLLKCDIRINGKLYNFSESQRCADEIVIRIAEDSYFIQAKRPPPAANPEKYKEEKTKLKAELNKILLYDKENHFEYLENLGNLTELNIKSIIVSLENLKKCDQIFSDLRKLRESQNKKRLSGFMISLKKILKCLNEQLGCKEQLNDINKYIHIEKNEENVEVFDSCNECGINKEKYKELKCGHRFCPSCIKDHFKIMQSKRILPKCPLSYCFYIMESKEIRDLLPGTKFKEIFTNVNLTCCLLCGTGSGLKNYDNHHRMCANCLREYAEYVSDGNIYEISEGRERVKEVICPFYKCELYIKTEELESCINVDRNVMRDNAISSTVHKQDEDSDDDEEEEKKIPKKKESKCFYEGCEAKKNELYRLATCKSSCDLYVCVDHQKQLSRAIRKNGKSCIKCQIQCEPEELAKLKDSELGRADVQENLIKNKDLINICY